MFSSISVELRHPYLSGIQSWKLWLPELKAASIASVSPHPPC